MGWGENREFKSCAWLNSWVSFLMLDLIEISQWCVAAAEGNYLVISAKQLGIRRNVADKSRTDR
jgi:hypothetical protein